MWNEKQEQIRLQQANKIVTSGWQLACRPLRVDIFSVPSAYPDPTLFISFFLSQLNKVKWAGRRKQRFIDSYKRNISGSFRAFLGESTPWVGHWGCLAQVPRVSLSWAAEILLPLGNTPSYFSNISLSVFINVCLCLGRNYTYISEYSYELPYFHTLKQQTHG